MIGPPTAPGAARRRGERFRYWPVALILAVGCLASFWGFEASWRANLRAGELELRTRLEQRHHAIANAIEHYENLVHGLRVYIEGTGGRQNQREFAAVASDLLKAHKGIQALDYAPRVPASRRRAYEAEQRERGRPGVIFDRITDGTPVPAGERSEYFPLRDVVPSAGNEVLFGLDLAADRRAVLERARDTGGLASTGPIHLLRKDAADQWGMIVAAPVYASAADAATLEDRRANLIGFAVGAFRIGDMVEAILPDATLQQNAYDQYLFYGAEADPARLVYAHSARLRGGGAAPPFAAVPPALAFANTISFADQTWTLVTVPLFHSDAPRAEDWRTLAFGLLMTGLAALYLFSALRRAEALRAGAETLAREVEERRRAEQRAERERDAAQGYLDVADVMILALTDDGKVSLINRKGAEVLGYAEAEIRGQDWTGRLIPARLHQQAQDRFRQLVGSAPGDAQCFESPVLTKSGEERLIAWRATTLVDKDGDCCGILKSGEDVTERRHAELLLRQSEARFRMLVEQAPDAILVYDVDRDRFIDANRNAMLLFACSREDLLRLGPAHFYPPEQPDRRLPQETFSEYGRRALSGEAIVFERAIRNAAGAELVCEVRLGQLPSAAGRLLRASFLDITERKRAEEALQFANTLLTAEMESSLDGILVVDDIGRILSFNQRFIELWQLPAEALAARDDAPLLAGVAAQIRDKDGFLERVRYLYGHPEESSRDELETVDGRFLDRWSKSLISGDGAYLGRIWFFRDITDRKRSEAQIARMARSDSLTGLPNRSGFEEALQQAIARARRGARRFAVLYLDLDRFKDINDTLGHPAGDRLLRAVAERLRGSIRETDAIARFGGDEFAVIDMDITEPASAAVLAEKLVKVLGEPYAIDGDEIRCTASIGIAVYGPDSPDVASLLSHADVALYRAKSAARGTYRFFTDAMDREVRGRIALGAEMRDAIGDDGQLALLYQPQVEIETGRVVAFEALVRWNHPVRGRLEPGEFIPMAERSGLIVPLGRWVLRETCRQTRQWLDAGIAPPVMAINLSSLQFKTTVELESDIAAILAETSVPAEILELELTESVLMVAAREHSDVLLRLRQSGLRIAIDDFGTGYSSLDYLRRCPVDRIKVAQTFITGLGTLSESAVTVRAALGLARELGIDTVAEGVETEAQLEMLRSWGCRVAQGFYFARPMTAPEAAALLRAGRIAPGMAEIASA